MLHYLNNRMEVKNHRVRKHLACVECCMTSSHVTYFFSSCIYIPHCLLIYTTRLFLTLLRIRLAVLVQQPAPECRIQILHQYLFVSFHRFDRGAWYVMCWVSWGCPDPDQKIRLGMLPATSSSRYGYIGYNNSRAEKRRWETLLEVGALAGESATGA